MKEVIADSNFPHTADGRVYHLGVKNGEVTNRILTVGDHVRARRIAQYLDSKPFEYVSQRGFTTLTGRYKGVPVSIVAIGMGYPMMDFFVRETRAVVMGDLIIVRFGSCGTLVPEIPVGRIVVCSRALAINTNYDHFHGDGDIKSKGSPYLISCPIPCDKALHDDLAEELSRSFQFIIGPVESNTLHAAGDSFYSSQGRIDPNFADQNHDLIETLQSKYPELVTLEMETPHLFHLAAIASRDPSQFQLTSKSSKEVSKDKVEFEVGRGKIRAAAAHMTFAGRVGGEFISPERTETLEKFAGKACLETLIRQTINDENLHSEKGSVWESK
ncbi:nucleoside phosphorylase domain-containing protein [Melampsora americana]|nr:nucleoside phosphorylase domain-containing protein [Melampsora americana]